MRAWILLVAVVAGLAPTLALADRPGERFALREGWRQERAERFQHEMPPRPQRERPHYPRRDDLRDGYADQGARPQRLTPEERRQLRRDVQDAGRDLYRSRR